jgi:RNA polymerase sigma-70 factor (ECF subfamily)
VASSDLQFPSLRLTLVPQPADADVRCGDYRLVQQLVAGDAQAWREFVLRFQRLLLTRVLAAAREIGQPLPPPDAEDLCAEVFSRLVAGNFAVLRRFEGRSTLSTWLCVVTRRIVIRRLAVARREPSRQTARSTPPIESLPGPSDQEPLSQLLGEEAHDLLAAGLAGLGERHRQLACLFYLDGCSYREISEQLDMPLNSIGPTLNRIQQKLRASMKAED